MLCLIEILKSIALTVLLESASDFTVTLSELLNCAWAPYNK